MTNTTLTPKTTRAIDKPHFQPYQWAQTAVDDVDVMIPGTGLADLARKTNELAEGIQTILEMIECNMLHREDGEKPLMSPYHQGTLLRMAIRSAEILASESQQSMDWAYKYHTAEGREKHEIAKATT